MFQARLILATNLPKRRSLATISHPWPWVMNLTLLILVGLLVLSYVMLANRLVAERYSLSTGKVQLDQANIILAQQNILIESQYSLDDLAVFARQAGLVEAKDYETLFTEPGLAVSARLR